MSPLLPLRWLVWQHWSYEGQLKQKRAVRNAIQSQGLIREMVKDCIGMDNPWNYRNKMGSLSLIAPLVCMNRKLPQYYPAETCLIAGNTMAAAAMEVAAWAKKISCRVITRTNIGLLRHLMVRQSFDTSELMKGCLHGKPRGFRANGRRSVDR